MKKPRHQGLRASPGAAQGGGTELGVEGTRGCHPATLPRAPRAPRLCKLTELVPDNRWSSSPPATVPVALHRGARNLTATQEAPGTHCAVSTSGEGPAPHPPPGRPGLLLREHLVAEVVRLGSEVVLAGRSLVVHNDKGTCSCHQGKDSHHDEDEVAGSQAWLRTWTLTCRQRDGRRWEGGLPEPGGTRL